MRVWHRNLNIILVAVRNLLAILVVLLICWGFVALVALTFWAFLSGRI